MFEKITKAVNSIKRVRFEIRSVWLFRFVVFIGLAPYVLAIFTWLFTWVTQNHDGWLFSMIDNCLKIGDKIWAPAVTAGLLNLVPKVDDADDDGKPDVDEREKEK